MPQGVALGIPFGKFFLVFRSHSPRVFFFLLDLRRFGLQFGLGRFHFFIARIDVDHYLENAVLVQTNLSLGKLDLMQQSFILFVGFYVEGLVAILGNFALQVFDIRFELLAIGFVALGRGLRPFQLRLGSSQLLFNHRYAFWKRSNFVLQPANFFIRSLQLQ